jgi:hypothetical protein
MILGGNQWSPGEAIFSVDDKTMIIQVEDEK